MAQMNFGGVVENVMTREEFPLEKAREILKDETIAVIGYGVQGPGQSLNLRDNGFNVIVGQRQGKTYEKAVEDGWVPGETLFGIEEACDKATIIMCLLSDAAVMSVWPTMKPYLTAGKALYFSHGFFRYLSRRYRQGNGSYVGVGYRYRFRLFVRDDFHP